MNNMKKHQRLHDVNCEQPIPFTFAEHFPASNANERQLPIDQAVDAPKTYPRSTRKRPMERVPKKQVLHAAANPVPIAQTQPEPLREPATPSELEALVATYQAADLVTKIALIENETRSNVLLAYYKPTIVIALALARNKFCSQELFLTLYALKKPKVTAVLVQNHRYQQLRHLK